MSARLAGLAWVTPLGTDLLSVLDRLQAGETAEQKTVVNPETGRNVSYLPVPPKSVDHLGRNPRLRRSSAISYYAVSAGLAAMKHAGLTVTPENAARVAVVFACSDGGVIYTRRFYEQIAKQGASSASPLLFPETVYNAPASHLAAELGIDGATYTLVGDASVGISAIHFGEELLASGDVDWCIVVAAEECDWILCEAYGRWRLLRTPLAEGAAAVVLGHHGSWSIRSHQGVPFYRQQDAARAMETVLSDLAPFESFQAVVRSANGTFVDAAETKALDRWLPNIRQIFPKRSLGEAPGASALWQVVAAALAIKDSPGAKSLATVVGFNQQASATELVRER